jgi:hypothetical protein
MALLGIESETHCSQLISPAGRRGFIEDTIVLSSSEERLRILWLKAVAATDPAEIDNLLLEFRDALHEHVEHRRAETKKLDTLAS